MFIYFPPCYYPTVAVRVPKEAPKEKVEASYTEYYEKEKPVVFQEPVVIVSDKADEVREVQHTHHAQEEHDVQEVMKQEPQVAEVRRKRDEIER